MFRIGFSEDIHPLKEGRPLYLGGVFFPDEIGLDGHSDADVILHALSEAMLGALALGDLGTFFPDSDEKYHNLQSSYFVERVYEMVTCEGYKINNIDIQVACATVRLLPHIRQMRENIAHLLSIEINQVSIKAMSYNKIGEIGNKEAIKASAIVLLENK